MASKIRETSAVSASGLQNPSYAGLIELLTVKEKALLEGVEKETNSCIQYFQKLKSKTQDDQKILVEELETAKSCLLKVTLDCNKSKEETCQLETRNKELSTSLKELSDKLSRVLEERKLQFPQSHNPFKHIRNPSSKELLLEIHEFMENSSKDVSVLQQELQTVKSTLLKVTVDYMESKEKSHQLETRNKELSTSLSDLLNGLSRVQKEHSEERVNRSKALKTQEISAGPHLKSFDRFMTENVNAMVEKLKSRNASLQLQIQKIHNHVESVGECWKAETFKLLAQTVNDHRVMLEKLEMLKSDLFQEMFK